VQTISGYADELGVPVYADPRLGREHLWAGSGVGVMCMNGPEFSGFLSGCPAHLRSSGPQSVDALRAVSGLVGCSILIVKLGPDGAVRYQSSTGTVSRQAAVDPGAPVVDPNGAGDTFLAATVRADLQGLGRADALLYAAAAAGAAVSVPGTAVVMRARALDVLRPHVGAPRGVVSLDDAARLAQRLKAFGYRIGYTNGCFDLSLTPGHSHVIERASGACDFLFVGVDSDARVRKLKGPQRPIVSEEQRVRTISSLRPVYAAFVFETCPSEVVLRLRPDFLFKGSSYALESMPEREAVEAVGCSFINLGTIDCPSTTNVLARVSRGSPL
jgi:D-beta-D-heptose 7-phosphate kinase/D-beta-D-heptose 1-phosphate adenosyltransferase